MIIGVTHDYDGRVVQRLSLSTKVSIGLPPNGDCNHPTKLDHFIFLRKKTTANRVEWEVDPDLTAHYGEQRRELHIILIDDDVENIFASSYAWWTATERKCWGDGVSATRRTPEKPGGQLWQRGNGWECEDSGSKRNESSLPAMVTIPAAIIGNILCICHSSWRDPTASVRRAKGQPDILILLATRRRVVGSFDPSFLTTHTSFPRKRESSL
jgi:hypothetical protein